MANAGTLCKISNTPALYCILHELRVTQELKHSSVTIGTRMCRDDCFIPVQYRRVLRLDPPVYVPQ
jgi:hypothetical protein